MDSSERVREEYPEALRQSLIDIEMASLANYRTSQARIAEL